MASSNRLLLLDTMALLYRAHFALMRNSRQRHKGVDTGGIMGFLNTLLDVKAKLKPTHIIAAMEGGGDPMRTTIYPAYKAHREQAPEGIIEALPYIEQILQGMGIPMVSLPGYEADDIIGTLAMVADEQGEYVHMISSDKDLTQLVTPHVTLYKPPLGKRPAEVWNVERVCTHWCVTSPSHVAEILALWGDASDNIPGVAGIGEKRAKALISQYKTLENLYAHIDEIPGAIGKKLAEQKEEAYLSRQLATIERNVPLTLRWEAYPVKKPDQKVLAPLLAELGLERIHQKLFTISLPTPLGPPMRIPFPNAQHPPMNRVKKVNNSYQSIRTLPELKKLTHHLLAQKAFAWDTESSGLDPTTDELLGISFSAKAGEGYYLILPKDKRKRKSYFSLLRPLLTNQNILKIGHNLKFDIRMLLSEGIEVEGPFFDTYIAHHLIEPESKHSLDALAMEYFNHETIKITSLIGPKGKGQKSLADLDPESITEYASEDADIAFRCWEVLKDKIALQGMSKLFVELEMPLMKVLAKMEQKGILLDRAILSSIGNEVSKEKEKEERVIYDLAQKQFNINSPTQLGTVLFEELKIEDNPIRTKTGKYATGEMILRDLEKKHPIIPAILNYRTVQKLQSTYIEALPLHLSPKDGRIHTSYHQAIVTTGRLSSSQPNLQNIPIRTPTGKMIRQAFVSPVDHSLIIADYSQIELRLMAHFAKETQLIEIFKQGGDLHLSTAGEIFNLPLEQVSNAQRRYAKMVNFSIIYGVSPFGLAKSLEISREEAKQIIDTYFARFPKIKEFMEQEIEKIKEQGYVETLFGRRKKVPDIHSRNRSMRQFAERFAINMVIQGSAAELMKKAMIDLDRWIVAHKIPAHLLLQIHDEIIVEVANHAVEETKEAVRSIMIGALQLQAPLDVEIEVGTSWFTKK